MTTTTTATPKRAKAAPTEKLTDLQVKTEEFNRAGVQFEVFEYRHGYFDLLYKNDEGLKDKLEYRPDGSEIVRNELGVEVKG